MNEKFRDICYDEPIQGKDVFGKDYILYFTKAIDGFGDAIGIFWDKATNTFTDDGYIICDLASPYQDDESSNDKRFFKLCDQIVADWSCHVTENGELTCKGIDKNFCLMQMVQSATALIALVQHSKDWQASIKKINQE